MTATPAPVVVGLAGDQIAVVRWAIDEAQRLGRPLRVVHCWAMSAIEAEAYVMADTTSAMRADGERILDQARALIDDVAPRLDAEYVVEYGITAQILLHESLHAASLVVGSDNTSWLGRVLGGELPARLGRTAPCPVVVVPERLVPGTGTGAVVVAIDGETAAPGPLRYGFDQADSRGRPLRVLHAIPPGATSEQFAAHRANTAEVVAGWQEQYPGVVVEQLVMQRDAVDECIDATSRAALLVLGHHHGRSGPSNLLHPKAAAVLRGARCPVVLVPLDQPAG